MIHLCLRTLPVLACLACAQGEMRSGAVALDQSFTTAGGSWSDGAVIWVMAKAVEQDGALAVCGSWTVLEQSVLTLNLHDRIIEGALVRIDGQTVIQNLRFMKELTYAPDLLGQQANCVTTQEPWRAGSAESLEIRIPRRSFGGRTPLSRSNGPRLTFREGPVPSLLE
ncbi:MAG: hypothetical protein AAGE80_17705 [Pseudomonadota bacterium]